MKTTICSGAKVYTVEAVGTGFTVQRNGRMVKPGSNAYEGTVAAFKRLAEDNRYAAREAAARTAC
jgi:hypothetical protein